MSRFLALKNTMPQPYLKELLRPVPLLMLCFASLCLFLAACL